MQKKQSDKMSLVKHCTEPETFFQEALISVKTFHVTIQEGLSIAVITGNNDNIEGS